MRRFRLASLALLISLTLPAWGEPGSFNTSIDAVSGGPDGFGWGLFPLGSSFTFYQDGKVSDSFRYPGRLALSFSFGFGNVSPSGYDWKTGAPAWSMTKAEQEESGFEALSGTYFRSVSQLTTYVEQGFGINPVAKSGTLGKARLSWLARYSMATEPLSISKDPNANDTFFAGNPIFGGAVPAYPWLEGDRSNWNHTLSFATYWYLRKSTGVDMYDGLYAYTNLEWGPWWMGNTSSIGNPTSDYTSIHVQVTEYLTIFSAKQDNGWNWLSLMLGHTNTLSYTWGDVIPEWKIGTDRMRGNFSDRVWLRFAGPQFIAADCYPYIELSMSNSLLFGGVQNDSTGTEGIELTGNFTGEFHLQLFGFIHIRYQLGYRYARGFDAQGPGWWHNGALGFYVSL